MPVTKKKLSKQSKKLIKNMKGGNFTRKDLQTAQQLLDKRDKIVSGLKQKYKEAEKMYNSYKNASLDSLPKLKSKTQSEIKSDMMKKYKSQMDDLKKQMKQLEGDLMTPEKLKLLQ